MKYEILWKMQKKYTNKQDFHYVLVWLLTCVYLLVGYVQFIIAEDEENPDYKT